MKKKQYDYIIVGAGSAGCVLANRLSANASAQVLLIEFGKKNKHILIDMPSALSYPMNMPAFNWGFQSTEEPHLDNRVINCPRGKGLGGTSTINGMVYVRGHACDFDEWHNLGAKGWNYANCLPYFQRAEHWEDNASTYRGKQGPLHVCTGNKMQNPLYKAFINAGIEAGYSQTSDYNGYKQEGFGPMQMTVQNGVRCSTDKAYLNPIKKRRNLTVITQALADRVLIEKGKAKGIRIISSNNQCIDYYASKEVILSAGAIGSCTILQRSGIGDPTTLKKAQIDVINDLPGVGQNLQDHIEIFFQYQCKKPITLNAKLSKRSKLLIGMQWLLLKKGLGATNHFESCAFIRSRPGLKSPDIQYHFLPAAIRYDGTQASEDHGFQVHVGPNKPKSRGSVTITSPHPLASPTILFNYLQHEEDIRDWRACVRLTDEILSQPALDDYRGDIIQPNIDLCSDEAIDAWVRNNAESAYHPCGTCKMGDENDPSAVVDANCKVIGIDQLRVVDSSVFPSITNGNLNAPTIMVAEKASDIILGNPPLSKPEANVWIPENWETEQRLYPQQL